METNEMNLNQETTMTAPAQQPLANTNYQVPIPDENGESTAVGVVIGAAAVGVIVGVSKICSFVKDKFFSKDEDDEEYEKPKKKKKKVKKSKKPVKKVVEEVEDEDDEIEEEDE